MAVQPRGCPKRQYEGKPESRFFLTKRWQLRKDDDNDSYGIGIRYSIHYDSVIYLGTIPIAVTAILASISYGALGIVKMSTVFSGYDNNTNILLAGMMVVGSSLFHTGITDKIGEKMIAITGKSERNIILATLIVSCILSSVCSNIGVMVAMAPLVTAMAESAGVGPSRALLGLLFGAQFGGFVTLVGVGSNAAAAAAMGKLVWYPSASSALPPSASACALWVPCTSPSSVPR